MDILANAKDKSPAVLSVRSCFRKRNTTDGRILNPLFDYLTESIIHFLFRYAVNAPEHQTGAGPYIALVFFAPLDDL